MPEHKPEPYIVRLEHDAIRVHYAGSDKSEALRDEQFSMINSLIDELNSKPDDINIQKKLGFLLYRELPIAPQDPVTATPVFSISDSNTWADIPWEYVYDGTDFPFKYDGAIFQIATHNKKPGQTARRLGPLRQLKVVMISTLAGTTERQQEIISRLQDSVGFYRFEGEDPQTVSRKLQGMQADIVLLDTNSSAYLMPPPLPETNEANANESKEIPPDENKAERIPQWNEVTAEYLFSGNAPALVLAPFQEGFALDALEQGADWVVLCSRYLIPEDEYYEFVLQFFDTVTSGNDSVSNYYYEVTGRWQQSHYREDYLKIPLLYTRHRLPQTMEVLSDQAEFKPAQVSELPEEKIEKNNDAIQQIQQQGAATQDTDTKVKEDPAATPVSSLPAPDLHTARELSSYRSDVAASQDKLGVQSDVENLCQVIMAKDWKPPLSIGLFGDWGSGKTSFINIMQHMIDATADRARAEKDSAFVENVIQIEFNAWHYLDANLWANLVVRILQGIHAAVFEPQTGTQQGDEFKQIVAHLHVLQQEVEKSEGRQQQLTSISTEIENQLGTQRNRQDTTMGMIGTLRTALADSDNAIARESDSIKDNLRSAAEHLGFAQDSDLSQVQSQARQFLQTGARIKKAWRDMRANKLWWLILPLAALLLWFAHGLDLIALTKNPVVDNLIKLATMGIGLLVGWGKTLAPHLKLIDNGLDAVEAATNKVASLKSGWLSAKQKELADLENQQTAVLAEIDTLETRRKEIDQEQQELILRLEQLQRGQGLEEFLLNRAGSSDYQEQLGIIALVHQDMKELQRKLRAGLQVDVDGKTVTRQYDRVILYIDDLDRCTPQRVVEVLQAVHLLLSIPLFVVVVAADPRWLLQCLLTHYQDLLHSDFEINDSEWAVTPQNYLEKIFQIPFTLPPMASRDFSRYVTDLFSQEEIAAETDPSELEYRNLQNAVEYLEIKTSRIQQQTAAETKSSSTGAPAADTAVDKPAAGKREPSAEDEELRRRQKELAQKRRALREAGRKLKHKQLESLKHLPTFESNPGSLQVSDDEKTFVTRLLPILSTPRTTKRMLNVYRLIRVSLSPSTIAAFERDEHQAVLVLLAIMYCYPAIAAECFNGLQQASETGITDYVRQKSELSNNSDWARLARGIGKVPAVQDMNIYRRWSKLVGRYSFQVGYELSREQE